jgi:hypothetical protein
MARRGRLGDTANSPNLQFFTALEELADAALSSRAREMNWARRNYSPFSSRRAPSARARPRATAPCSFAPARGHGAGRAPRAAQVRGGAAVAGLPPRAGTRPPPS